MRRGNLPWRLIVSVVLVVISLVVIIPVKQKIRLGLDLQGGSHILLEVWILLRLL